MLPELRPKHVVLKRSRNNPLTIDSTDGERGMLITAEYRNRDATTFAF